MENHLLTFCWMLVPCFQVLSCWHDHAVVFSPLVMMLGQHVGAEAKGLVET